MIKNNSFNGKGAQIVPAGFFSAMAGEALE
jgi:hypothetical protein